jgi:hypothetical protein
MRKLVLTFIFLSLTSASLKAQDIKVLTKELSIRNSPSGELIETVNRGDVLELENLLGFWGKSPSGWLNVDFGDYRFPRFKKMGELNLKVGIVLEPNGKFSEGDVILLYKELQDSVIGTFRGEPVEVEKELLRVEEWPLKLVVANFKTELEDRRGRVAQVKAGAPLLEGPEGFIYRGHLYQKAEIKEERSLVDSQELLKEINRLVDIFNSVKLSSPLSERLGYYVKTLPVKSSDIQVVRTPTGIGIFVKLKSQFVTKDGEPITGRKTRFFLKKSNYEFWRKLTEELFNSGVNKFVEIDLYRFDGKGNFEEGGFVASSYHAFKEGKLKDYRSFLDNSESNVSEDMWFFADQVYERLEDGD